MEIFVLELAVVVEVRMMMDPLLLLRLCHRSVVMEVVNVVVAVVMVMVMAVVWPVNTPIDNDRTGYTTRAPHIPLLPCPLLWCRDSSESTTSS